MHSFFIWVEDRDEYSDYNPSVTYLPHAAVVNRCGKEVGCCKNGQECSPVETETITFVFEQIVSGQKKEKKHISLVSHVSCGCQGQSAPR